MSRVTLSLIAAALCCFQHEAFSQTTSPFIDQWDFAAEGQQYPENFYIGPRIGISGFTGVGGVEAQFGRWAATAGWVPDGCAIGAKHYFKPYRSSWYVGVGYLSMSHDDVDETAYGASAGYRWRWGSGWDLALGLGLGHRERIEKVRSLQWSRREYEHSDSGFIPYPDIAFGYSF